MHLAVKLKSFPLFHMGLACCRQSRSKKKKKKKLFFFCFFVFNKSFNRKPSGFDWRLNGIGDIRDVTALISLFPSPILFCPIHVLLLRISKILYLFSLCSTTYSIFYIYYFVFSSRLFCLHSILFYPWSSHSFYLSTLDPLSLSLHPQSSLCTFFVIPPPPLSLSKTHLIFLLVLSFLFT